MEISIEQKNLIFRDIFALKHSKNELMLKYHPDKQQHSDSEFIFLQDILKKLKNHDNQWAVHVGSVDEIKRRVGFRDLYENVTLHKRRHDSIPKSSDFFDFISGKTPESTIKDMIHEFFSIPPAKSKKPKVCKQEQHENTNILFVADITNYLNEIQEQYAHYRTSAISKCRISMTQHDLEQYCTYWVRDIVTNCISKKLGGLLLKKFFEPPKTKKNPLLSLCVTKDINWQAIICQKLRLLFIEAHTTNDSFESWMKWLYHEKFKV
jgi:hypothetical protein